MRSLRVPLAVLVLLVASLGCGEKSPAKGEQEGSSAAAVEGAFCAEHGVLEAVCTKCNPKLIPVFKAKGDWCDEHGFPESLCPICHPERGGKPATDVAGDDAPADGTKVRFRTKDTASLAGIEVVAAKLRPGGARLKAVATIVYDATRYAEVNARAPGVVKALKADIGMKVELGQALAIIDSAAVGADRSRLRAATSRVEIAKAEYDRESELRDLNITSEKDVLAAKLEWENARSEQASARAAVSMVGSSAAESGSYVLRAPLAGTVTARQATIGHMVDLETMLFEIVDTSVMWAEADLPEDTLSLAQAGQQASVVLDSMPEHEWSGRVDYIAPIVDPRTRTAKARIALDNPEGQLRANMYGTALLELAEAKPTVMVPTAAVQRAGDVKLAFVRIAEDVFEARRLRLGLTEGDFVEVLSGVNVDELVATTGSFLLKTETLKGSIGAGCCDVE